MENSRRHPQLDFFGEEREMCDREEVRKGRGDPMMLKNCRGMVPNTIKIPKKKNRQAQTILAV